MDRKRHGFGNRDHDAQASSKVNSVIRPLGAIKTFINKAAALVVLG